MKVIKQNFDARERTQSDAQRRRSSPESRRARSEADRPAGPDALRARDEATLARELAARIQQMNEDTPARKPSITVKKMQIAPTSNARMVFNPLHPSQELPPEQLIRLISLHAGGEPKRAQKPRQRASEEAVVFRQPAAASEQPVEAIDKAPAPAPRFSIRFDEPEQPQDRPGRWRLLGGLVAVTAIVAAAAVPMFLKGYIPGISTPDLTEASKESASASATATPVPGVSKVTSARKLRNLPAGAASTAAPTRAVKPAAAVEHRVKPDTEAREGNADPTSAKSTAVAPSARDTTWDDSPAEVAPVTRSAEPETGELMDSRAQDAVEVPLADIDLGARGAKADSDGVDPAPAKAAMQTAEPAASPEATRSDGAVFRDTTAQESATPDDAPATTADH